MTAERGNTKHGPQLDEQLEHEARGMVQGHGGAPHAEPFRESEPLPDDTDAPEVERAFRRDGPDPRDARDGRDDREGDA